MTKEKVCINKVRDILSKIWNKSQAKGRCWGRKRGANPLGGSHITIFQKNEIVTVLRGKSGKFKVLEYRRARKTSLGTEIKSVLEKNEIPME